MPGDILLYQSHTQEASRTLVKKLVHFINAYKYVYLDNQQSNLFADDDLLEDESLYLPDDDASHYLTEPSEQKPLTLTEILQNGIELDHFKV